MCPGWESNSRPLSQQSGSLTTRPTCQSLDWIVGKFAELANTTRQRKQGTPPPTWTSPRRLSRPNITRGSVTRRRGVTSRDARGIHEPMSITQTGSVGHASVEHSVATHWPRALAYGLHSLLLELTINAKIHFSALPNSLRLQTAILYRADIRHELRAPQPKRKHYVRFVFHGE